jgi:uncharacterized protein YdhG (YjbR/CyaY superfamily)
MTKAKSGTVDEYIDAFPKDIQDILKKIRLTIKETAPGAEEIISYKIPSFKLNGGYLIYFAAWKKHIGFYPITSSMEKSIKELSLYKTSGKETVQFPLDKPMPLSLIKKIIRYRMKEIPEKEKGKKKKK